MLTRTYLIVTQLDARIILNHLSNECKFAPWLTRKFAVYILSRREYWAQLVSSLPLSVYFRWSEPLSSSQLTECCRYAAWKKSTACPTIIEIDSWRRRGGARSASASTLPTDTRTTTHTPCTTAHTAGTSAWDGAASSGRSTSRNPHKGTD